MADANVSPTSPRRAVGLISLAIDALAATLFALVCVTALASSTWGSAVVGLVFASTCIVLWRGILGSSFGHAALRLRSVDALTGVPSFRFRGSRITVGRGTAADPFTLRARPIVGASPASGAGYRERSRSRLRLVVDDGSSYTIQHAALIGRDPTVPPDPRHTLIAIPDLSRTISKSHLLIEITDDELAVTDLKSSSGTMILGERTPLVPYVRTMVPWGAKLALGERHVTLQRRRWEGA